MNIHQKITRAMTLLLHPFHMAYITSTAVMIASMGAGDGNDMSIDCGCRVLP